VWLICFCEAWFTNWFFFGDLLFFLILDTFLNIGDV
jgi:hypothetical protein